MQLSMDSNKELVGDVSIMRTRKDTEQVILTDELLEWMGNRFQDSPQQTDLKWTFEQFIEEQLYILRYGYICFPKE